MPVKCSPRLRAKWRFLKFARKTSLKTKRDFCGNHCRKSPMRSIDDGGPAALHNASDQARCNPATLYPASKNDHQPPQRNNRSCLVPLDSSHATIITHRRIFCKSDFLVHAMMGDAGIKKTFADRFKTESFIKGSSLILCSERDQLDA